MERVPKDPRVTTFQPLAPIAAICLLILPVMLTGWALSFYPFDDLINRDGKPLMVDFMCFYLAGECVADNKVDRLYDDKWAHLRSREVLPNLATGLNLPNRYPPLMAVISSPLSRCSYGVACLLFLGAEITVFAATVLWWRNDLPALKEVDWRLFLAISFGFPLVLECLMDGQLGVFSLALLSAGILLIRRNQIVLAGFVLGVAMLKPVVALLVVFGLTMRYPKLLIGLTGTGATILLTTYCTTGLGPLQEFLSVGTRLATDQWAIAAPPWKIQGLQSNLLPIMPQLAMRVTVFVGAMMVVALVWYWRKSKLSDYDAMSLLLIINGLFGMYVPIYDLLLLLPVLYLQAEQARLNSLSSERSYPWRLVTLELLPALALIICLGPHLSQAIMMKTGFQPFSLVLLAFTIWMIWKSNRPLGNTARPDVRIHPGVSV